MAKRRQPWRAPGVKKDVSNHRREQAMTFTRVIALIVLGAAALALGDGQTADQRQYVPPGEMGQKLQEAGRNIAPGPGVGLPTAPRSRYRTLLRKIEAPNDQATFGDFYDYGYWSGTSYLGQNELPPGYWVYLAPNWYIFRDDVSSGSLAPAVPRQWGPEQATGAPDTWPRSGDIGTAWASKTPDGQEEWLQLTYESPVRPTAIMVYETYNPGALTKITTIGEDGREVELWSGKDPSAPGSEKGISVVPVHPQSDVKCIKLYLDSVNVAGWNEIDAVGLVDETGKTHWATSATASSTYADTMAQPAPRSPIIYERLLDR
jgi:hypothetical protein